MSKVFTLFLVVFFSLSVFSQTPTNVTFDKNIFYINGQKFFPIGWYNVATNELRQMKADSVNVVLPNFYFLVREDGDSTNISPSKYYNNLMAYFDTVDAINSSISDQRLKIKVVVQIPNNTYADSSQGRYYNIRDYMANVVVDSIIKQPALLGWYTAD
ncbi:MAG: hypothetical protein HYV28_18565 [Ignavibacteriales bacterium]|nr:hypothetical protein [Ignavibacteriales bacterium]